MINNSEEIDARMRKYNLFAEVNTEYLASMRGLVLWPISTQEE